MEIWLVRHGESEAQKKHLMCGDLDIPLTPNGLLQAETLGKKISDSKIQFDKSYVSPLGRTLSTAQAMGLTNYQVLPEIKEWALGIVGPKTFQQVSNEGLPLLKPRIDIHYAPEQGESLTSLNMRSKQCLSHILQHSPSDKLILIGHAGFFNMLLMEVFEIPLHHFPFFDFKNCSPIILHHAVNNRGNLPEWLITQPII